MQIGISSASLYPQMHTEAALVNLAAMGCRNVEVFLQTRSEYKRRYARQLAAVCSQMGLKVHSVHAASSHFEPLLFYNYRRQVKDGFDTLNMVLEAAANLGSQCYTFHGPLRVTNVDPPRFLEQISAIAAVASRWEIKLALENVSWCTGWQPGVFSWLTRQQVPNLYFTFDNKQAVRSGFDPADFIRAMGSSLVTVHLSDVSEQGIGLLPGGGTVNFPLIFKALKEIEFTGPAILEVYGFKVPSASQLMLSWKMLNALVG